jgi:ATP-dependent Lhr-like helicase
VSRDTPEPSAFAHEILNAKPYAFLDDAPLEERRTQAVQTRIASNQAGSEMSALDANAIERVRDEERPDPRDVDELHDALLTTGFLRDDEITIAPEPLTANGRATRVTLGIGDRGSGIKSTNLETRDPGFQNTTNPPDPGSRIPDPGRPVADPRSPIPDPCAYAVWVAAERLPEILAVHPEPMLEPLITAPSSRVSRAWTREAAIVELLRGRLSIVGPTTAEALGDSLAITAADANAGLLALEAEGAVLRGHFSPDMGCVPREARGVLSASKDGPLREAPTPSEEGDGSGMLEWCDRRLLSRIHRYTLNRLRAEISPVAPADFMRFLFVWQHVEPSSQLTGIEGLRELLEQLDGAEAPARSWERQVLAARLDRYDPAMLDMLCLTGAVAWARLSSGSTSAPRNSAALRRGLAEASDAGGPTQVIGATPIALFLREHADAWLTLSNCGGTSLYGSPGPEGSTPPSLTLDHLRTHGASFASELALACGLNAEQMQAAIADLVAAGAISSDGFAGLRSIVGASPTHSSARLNRVDASGRWFALRADATDTRREAAVETLAWTLLRRYGVVFRRVLVREAMNVPWRELARVYRRLEARGEIRGGRFVTGLSGEQFALPDAVERLREVRRSAHDGRLLTIGAADPLNLSGIITGEERVRASAANRIVYRDGVPIAAMEGDMLRVLSEVDPDIAADAAAAAAGRRVPVISGYVGRIG